MSLLVAHGGNGRCLVLRVFPGRPWRKRLKSISQSIESKLRRTNANSSNGHVLHLLLSFSGTCCNRKGHHGGDCCASCSKSPSCSSYQDISSEFGGQFASALFFPVFRKDLARRKAAKKKRMHVEERRFEKISAFDFFVMFAMYSEIFWVFWECFQAQREAVTKAYAAQVPFPWLSISSNVQHLQAEKKMQQRKDIEEKDRAKLHQAGKLPKFHCHNQHHVSIFVTQFRQEKCRDALGLVKVVVSKDIQFPEKNHRRPWRLTSAQVTWGMADDAVEIPMEDGLKWR